MKFFTALLLGLTGQTSSKTIRLDLETREVPLHTSRGHVTVGGTQLQLTNYQDLQYYTALKVGSSKQ